jgi:hypothetical protein
MARANPVTQIAAAPSPQTPGQCRALERSWSLADAVSFPDDRQSETTGMIGQNPKYLSDLCRNTRYDITTAGTDRPTRMNTKTNTEG